MSLTAVEDIYNLSLGLIGDYTITSGQTSTKWYLACERFYPISRDEMLISHKWNEAIEDVIIMQESTAPLIEYAYKYEKPSDCLRVISIGTDLYMWEVKGQYIVTDYTKTPGIWEDAKDYVAGQYVQYEDVTYLCGTSHTSSTWAGDSAYWTSQGDDYGVIDVTYIKQLTDADLFSPGLKAAIVHSLAVKVAVSLKGDAKLKDALNEELRLSILPSARSVDAVEGRLKPIFQSKWIRSRGL